MDVETSPTDLIKMVEAWIINSGEEKVMRVMGVVGRWS